jgi:tetratricopeptide (TPR) repeat protein
VDDNRLAVDSYERALKINSDDAGVSNVLTDLGVSYRKMNNVDKALECFDRALAKDPKHWQALFNSVIVYGIDKNDKPKAREVLSRLKKEQPGNPAVDRLEALLEGKVPAPGASGA